MSDSEALPTLMGLGSRPESLFSTGVALLAITWLTVLLRVWVRGVMIRSFGLDDVTIVLTMAPFTVQCSYLIRMALKEMQPVKNDNIKQISILTTDTIAFSGSYAITCVLLKISLGLFFLRIIIERWQRNIIYICMGVNTAYGLVYFGLVTFGCGDPNHYLAHLVENKCTIPVVGGTIPASFAHTALNALVDWTFAILPISSLWNLNMARRPKIWAFLLLILGALGSIVSLVRFRYVDSLTPGREFFKESAIFGILSTIEPGLGIAAVSLATLRPLFRSFLETARSISGTQRSDKGRGPSDIQLKGLSARSQERAGFRTVESDETTSQPSEGWIQVALKNDPEKGRHSSHDFV